MTLKELYNKNQYSTDKESVHHYLDVYDRLFAPFKDKKINLLEVGYATGGSIELWKDYFVGSNIFCIDKDGSNFKPKELGVYLFKYDINEMKQSDFDERFDIAIDDGSHFVKDQLTFFNLLWPVMNKGGLLIIEDVDNIEGSKKEFDSLSIPYEIVDLRGTYDSVLLIFRK